MVRKTKPAGFPWLVVRSAGVDEYGTEADARADANGGLVIRKSAVFAIPTMVTVLRAALELIEQTERSGCVCDEPPYCPEEGEEGQIECPACVARDAACTIRGVLAELE